MNIRKLAIGSVGIAATLTSASVSAIETCRDLGDGTGNECSMRELNDNGGTVTVGALKVVLASLPPKAADEHVFVSGVYHDGKAGLYFDVRDNAMVLDACTTQDLYDFSAYAFGAGKIKNVFLDVDYDAVFTGSGASYDGAYLYGFLADRVDAPYHIVINFFAPEEAAGNDFQPPLGEVLPVTMDVSADMVDELLISLGFSQAAPGFGSHCGEMTELNSWTVTFECEGSCAEPPRTLFSSVLPSGRSVQVGVAATAFATILNGGTETATNCSIRPVTPPQGTFLYQTTDPATNALTGTPDTPVDIDAGSGQSFLIAFTAAVEVAPRELAFDFDCANTEPAASVPGLNTLLFSASSTPVPDVIALASTPTQNGVLYLPGASGSNAFGVATANVGAGGMITASADTGGADVPVALFICATDLGGACLNPPETSVTSNVAEGATPTYSIFGTATGGIPFDPAGTRISVRFEDDSGVSRGATSVAVTTDPP